MTRTRKLLTPLLAWLAFGLLWLLHRTYRLRVHGALPEGEGPRLFAFWHGEQQLILPYRPAARVAVLTSRSADGQLQARVLTRLGFEPVAGSSSRGGAAGLLGLVRKVRQGVSVALAVDGPRGPRGQAKGGVVQLARLTGAPIVPVRARCARAWIARRSWDRFALPLPFARIDVYVLAPVWVARRTDGAALAVCVARLSERLQAPFTTPQSALESAGPGARVEADVKGEGEMPAGSVSSELDT